MSDSRDAVTEVVHSPHQRRKRRTVKFFTGKMSIEISEGEGESHTFSYAPVHHELAEYVQLVGLWHILRMSDDMHIVYEKLRDGSLKDHSAQKNPRKNLSPSYEAYALYLSEAGGLDIEEAREAALQKTRKEISGLRMQRGVIEHYLKLKGIGSADSE